MRLFQTKYLMVLSLLLLFVIASSPKASCTETIEELIQGAQQGDVDAQNDLGVMYYHGEGVPQNYKKAFYWFKKAAKKGLANAQHNLGIMYYRGQGVSQNYNMAFYWCKKAAEKGFANAQHTLSAMYYYGEGVPQNLVQAYIWVNLAAAQGDEAAINTRDVVKQFLTPNQIARAQELSTQLHDKISQSQDSY